MIRAEWYAAQNIAEGGAEENDQQDAGDRERRVEEVPPDAVVQVRAKLDANRSANQQPKNNVERQIKAAEAGGVEQRKSIEKVPPAPNSPPPLPAQTGPRERS